MMQITEIEPGKKYVLVLPGASKEEALLLECKLKIYDELRQAILVVYGTNATVVPADQIVGYTTLE